MKKITICACSSRTIINKEKAARIAVLAQKAGMEVELVSDLCELCESKDEKVHEIAQTTIVACHERAVKSLLEFCGEDMNASSIKEKCQNLRTEEAPKVLMSLGLEDAEVSAEDMAPWMEQLEAMPKKMGEDAWYPTLDKDLCAECGKCFEFCPFGVYEMIEDRVRVVHPTHCKNNCPACARTCPASAIIFPKYDRSPINGGEEKQENAIKLDTAFDFKQNTELYGQTLRDRLAARRTSILKK